MKTLLWIVVAVVIIGGSWFAVTHFSGGGHNLQPAVVPIEQTAQYATQTSPVTSNQSNTTGSSQATCSYLIQDDFNSVQLSQMHQVEGYDPEQCYYHVDQQKDTPNSTILVGQNNIGAFESGSNNMLNVLNGFAIDGIGDKAIEADQKSPDGNSIGVVIYYLKNSTIVTIYLYYDNSETIGQLSSQAKALAKIVATRI